ncbi:hypothetical protein [Altererythrobacter sp. GH1-8]|uniref:hypothetical protein n=1 Tax=Altererythrobacter sp. GH1-8 TaxID=3349333 RepID=UPI00374DDEEE
MTDMKKTLLSIALALPLAACATTAPPSPVEVTRFHQTDSLAQLGQGAIFVVDAPAAQGKSEGSLELAPYKAAVARELAQLGYAESGRDGANHIAEVRLERFVLEGDDNRRGPVSVGVGGSTGGYRSGVGIGLGFNLGGGGSSERLGTEMAVVIRNVASNAVLWEGRARFEVGPDHPLAQPAANADVVADALFQEFPGGNGETIEVKVSQ